MFRSKTDNGQEIIDKAVGAFQEVVEELDKGITMCDAEEDDLNNKMDELSKRKASIAVSRGKAIRVKKNIEQMLK